MAVTRQKKEELLKDLIEDFKKAKTIVFANSQGLSVKAFEELRNTLREKGVGCKVAKKTLMNLAAKESGIDNLDTKKYEGAVVALFSFEDEIEGARIAHKFAKDNEVFAIRGGIADGAVHDERYIIQLAQLPTKEELLGTLVGVMQGPVRGFHGACHGLIRGLAQVIKAHADKLGA